MIGIERSWNVLISFNTPFDSAVSDMSQQPKMSMTVFDPCEDFGNILNSQAEKDNRLIAFSGGSNGYVGRCTAPLLVDRQRLKAVSNDSEEIVRMIVTAEVELWGSDVFCGRKMRSEDPKIFFIL